MLTANELKTEADLKYEPDYFRSEERAWSFADHCLNSRTVMMGEDEIFIVPGCMADAAKLEQAGYEFARW